MTTYQYRPEIDGLRAIAVLAVIITHANTNWLPSGYLGVDVFFVISGFLITKIILREMLEGHFSFIEFYKRRAKRLLPALITVLSITTILTYFLFLAEDFILYLKSLFASLLFLSNIYFARNTNYFDIAAQEKPLLHLWSLSIEEQFYFLFPIILLLSIKFFRSKLPLIIASLIIVSLLSRFIPFFNWEQYYLPQVRAYELLIGALFATLVPKKLSITLQWLALANIILFIALPSKFLAFFDGYLERLIICFSTALLLWNSNQQSAISNQQSAISNQNNLTPNNLLRNKIFIFFGIISYSLYLWHWVILALLHYIYMQQKIPSQTLIISILLSIILAYITYRLIENPLRRVKNFTHKKFFICLSCYSCITIFTAAFLFYENRTLSFTNKNSNHSLGWDKNICYDKLASNDLSCQKGDLSTKPSILVIGDSHAGQYNEFFDYIGKKEGWSSINISSSGCTFLIGVRSEKEPYPDACNSMREYALNQIDNFDSIILISYWNIHISQDTSGVTFTKNFENLIEYLISKNKKIYVFKDNPTINISPLRYFKMIKFINNFSTPPQYDPVIIENEGNDIIQKIINKYPDIIWIDLNPYIPDNFIIDNLPIYKDKDHINPYGARKIAERFAEKEKFIK